MLKTKILTLILVGGEVESAGLLENVRLESGVVVSYAVLDKDVKDVTVSENACVLGTETDLVLVAAATEIAPGREVRAKKRVVAARKSD